MSNLTQGKLLFFSSFLKYDDQLVKKTLLFSKFRQSIIGENFKVTIQFSV